MIRRLISKFEQSKEWKNAGWLISGRVIQLVFSFFVSVFTARYLGPANYGLIQYAGAYVTFFTSLCTLGINSIIIKDFVDNPLDQGTALGTTFVLRFLASLGSVIIINTVVFFLDYGETETIIVSALCSISLLFQAFDTINCWFQFRYQAKITSIATLIAFFATTVYKVILLVLKKDIYWFAFTNSIDFLILAIVLLAAYKWKNGPRLRFSWMKGRALLARSYHYIISGAMISIYMQTDKLMLKQMLDEHSVGIYSLASSLNFLWVFVLQAIIDSMYPTIIRLFKTDYAEYEKKNKQLYSIVIYLSVFVAFMFILLGRFMIVLLYGSEYSGAYAPLSIIAWYTVFSYLGVARNAWLVCEDKQKYLKYMYFCAAILNVGLNAAFIPRWGVKGAAFASLFTQMMTCIGFPLCIRDLRKNVGLMKDALLMKGIR